MVKAEFLPNLNLNSKFKVSTNKFLELPKSSPEILQIFVVGPSIHGKTRILEYFANRHLGIPAHANLFLAHELNGLMLKGINVQMNFWHVGDIKSILGVLQHMNNQYKTSFMLIYDVHDFTTFYDVRHWIPSLRNLLGGDVKIVLIAYEELVGRKTPGTLPISYSDGVELSTAWNLECFYQFSDLTGTGVNELFFEAAHLALESKKMAPVYDMHGMGVQNLYWF